MGVYFVPVDNSAAASKVTRIIENTPGKIVGIAPDSNEYAFNRVEVRTQFYETYESKTYGQKTRRLQKRAIVYVPYGYSCEQKYNVFYLMHGGWGNETTTLAMGSVATWRTFQYSLDYFQYFLPMSCGTSLDEENIFSAAANRGQSDYFVWVITGTADFAYRYDENKVKKMRNSPYFTESSNTQNGNFAYHAKEGYAHNGTAAMEYTYNGLRWFWNTERKS